MSENIDALMATLDQLMADGVGHVNVSISDDQPSISIDQTINECKPGSPCYTPTLSIMDSYDES